MRSGKLTLSFFGSIAISLAVLLVMPVAASAVSDFDIPLSELNKVKKKTPSKRVTKEPKKRKRSDARFQKKSAEAAAPTETAGQAKTPPVESNSVIKSETHPKSPVVSEQSSEPELTQIHHFPYSFVVAGKRTVIHAVINSKPDVQEVNCTLTSVEGGTQDLVKMVKVDGTRFTYTATLPGLPPESPSLRYTIFTVDSLGKVTRSREFVIPVTPSPVVPNWQIENTGETVPVKQEDEKKLPQVPSP